MAKNDCPTDQALRNYILGNCSDDVSDEIEGHLAQCTACEATISQLDSADDTLVRHLPLAAAAQVGAAARRPDWIDELRRQPPSAGQVEIQSAGVERETQPAGSGEASRLPDGCANYELLGVLGRGGMGVVFLARHRQLNRRVALKVVRPEALSSGQARRRFQREIEILGGLNHPGIVMAIDAGTVGTGAYLVMELIDGADLGRVVREGGPLTIEAACEAGRQIAAALAAAHGGGVVHRDVKPSNIMVDLSGRVRLLDFGLAHMTFMTQHSGETSVERLLGTLDFMAPEQADAQRPVDARADLYGLGATLYFLLTGRPPHGSRAGRSILEHIRVVSHDDAPPVSSVRVDVPAELDALVAQLLRRDPDNRPKSAADVAAALARWAGGNLAGRVAELKSRLPIAEPEASAAARQSFADLLETGEASPSAVSSSSASSSRRGRRLRKWIAWAALAGIVLAGVTIWLKTPQGTLKIESEVGDVVVEAHDERDQVRELRINKGTNEIVLDAGKYRVRLAGTHDGIDLDRDVITLRRGDEKIARITRLVDQAPADHEHAALPAAKEGEPGPTERLYQGKPESEWKRLFAAETEHASKLEAAHALLALSGEMPPQPQLERILDVGEEVVRASYGEAGLEFAFENPITPPGRAQLLPFRGQGGPDFKAYYQFSLRARNLVQNLSAEVLAKGLSQAVLKGSDPRAGFAVWLLRTAAGAKIETDPAAVQVVVKTLGVPLQGMDRSAVCLLVRSRFATKLPEEQRRGITEELDLLARRLLEAPNIFRQPAPKELRDSIRVAFLKTAQTSFGPDAPPPRRLMVNMARMILDEIVEAPNTVTQRFTDYPRVGIPTKYRAEAIAATRRNLTYFLDAWVYVANAYLEEHLSNPADRWLHSVVQTLDAVLQLYSEGDDWPVEKTRALLTDLLRAYYADAPENVTDQPAKKSLASTPAALLTQIVRISGQIPEFVRAGHPRSAAVVKKLKKFEICLTNQTDSPQFDRHFDFATGLLDEAPFEAIKLCVSRNYLYSPDVIIVRGLPCPATPTELLYAVSGFDLDRNNRSELPADPLLVLAVLADLTGQSEAQDERIATLFTEGVAAKMFRASLEDVLSGTLKARAIARQLLQKMAAGAKSEKLTKALRDLLPPAV